MALINIEDKVLKKAVMKYGYGIQGAVCMEECGELIQEISKQIRGVSDKTSLTEEMADVAICLKQLQLMYNIADEDLQLVINQKLARLEGRICDE